MKTAAKSVLALSMSSAVVERLLNAAGLLLGNFRRCMQPAVVTNLVSARYGCKIKVPELARGLPTCNPLTPIGEQEVGDFLDEPECADRTFCSYTHTFNEHFKYVPTFELGS